MSSSRFGLSFRSRVWRRGKRTSWRGFWGFHTTSFCSLIFFGPFWRWNWSRKWTYPIIKAERARDSSYLPWDCSWQRYFPSQDTRQWYQIRAPSTGDNWVVSTGYKCQRRSRRGVCSCRRRRFWRRWGCLIRRVIIFSFSLYERQ